MILLSSEGGVVTMRFTVSLSADLASVLDDLAQQWKIGRSGVVARLLEEAKTIQLRESLMEGYKAMAGESAETAEQTLAAQAEVILK
jgi:metal-responsive CopG/Arc/MetJ family transcriptional regulator